MATFCLPKKGSPMRRQLDIYLNSCTKLTPEQAEMALIIMLDSGKWEGLGDYPTEQQLIEVFTPKPIVLKSKDEIEAYIQAYKTGIIDSNVLPQGSVNEISGKNGKKIPLLARVSTSDENLRTRLNEALFYGDSEQGIQCREAFLKKDAIPNHVLEDAVIADGSVKIQLKEKGEIKTIKILPNDDEGVILLDTDTSSIITDPSYKDIQTYFKDIYKGTDLDESFENLTGIPKPSKFSKDFVKSPDTDIQKAKTNIKTEIVKYRNNDGTLTAEGKKLFTQLFDADALPEGTTDAVLDNGQLVLNIHRRDNHTGDLADFRAVVDFSSGTPKVKLTLNGNSVDVNSSNHMEIAAIIKNKFSGIEGSAIDYLAKHGVQSNDNLKKPVGTLDTIKAIMQKQRIDIEKTEIGAVKLGDRIYDKLPENYEYQTCQNVFPKSNGLNTPSENIEKGKTTVEDVTSDIVDAFKIVRANLNHEDALKPYSHNSRYFVKYQGRYFDVTKAVSDVRDGGDYTSEHLQNAIISEVNSAIKALKDSKSLSDWAKREEFSNKELSNQEVSQKSDNQSIVSQLTTHLKSMGIEVHGKKDMEEFLKNNDPQELQKMEEQREMEEIKQKAIADGTFMKAPNGKKSNLTEKQWLQTRTKNFKNWFGDWQNDPENASKVVDENGEPLVVYHGGAQNIRVFRSSNKEESNTGFGYYTDPKTGEKIPMDSNRTIFFSSNPFVAESYQVLYALNQLNSLLTRVESLISTTAQGKISIDAAYIKDWEHYWKTLDQLSEFNPRFTKLKQWLQQLKQEGKKPSEKEVDAYKELLIETGKALQPFTQTYHMNTSSWKNDNVKVKAFLDRYSTPEGIRKLKQGEIPTEIQSLWNVQLKKIANAQKEGTLDVLYDHVSLFAGSGSFNNPIRTLSFDGKTLTIGSNGEHTDITSLSEHQIADALEDFRTVNNHAIKSFEDEESYNTILKRSEQYAVFLNIRKPLSHDYEGTVQGGGYKESTKYPFGYVAARQVDKAIKDGNDGIVYQNIKDPYLADNYGVFNSNQIKSATDNNGDFSTTNPDIQAYINKYDLPKGELTTLSSTLMTKYGNKTAYGDVMQTANYEYTVNYKGAGEFDIIEYHQIDNNSKGRINDKERRRVSGSFDRLSVRDEVAKGEYPSDSYNVADGEANGDNVRLDKQTSPGESKQVKSDVSSRQHQGWSEVKRDSATGRISFVEGDGRTIDGIEKFQTPQGELYGFVDKDGKMYLDETVISPEHPIHEYTHLWDRAVQQKNPELWSRGVELMKQIPLWNEILNDANYGKVWQSKGLPQSEIDNFIASEVHARLTGKNGEKLLNQIAKEQGHSGIIGKLKQWILDVWKELRATFGTWSKEDLDKLTLEDFNRMTVRDFAEGNLGNNNTEQSSKKIQGENIYSKGSEFAKKLTNIGNDLTVVYKGRTFRNAEHAYQTWKSGEFDETAFNSNDFKPKGAKPANKQTNYHTMVEIITAKLQQHPELVEGISERGGVDYLNASWHKVNNDSYWESNGQNMFMKALTEAFQTVTISKTIDIPTIEPSNSTIEFKTNNSQAKKLIVNAPSENSYFHKESFDPDVTDIGYEGDRNEKFFMIYHSKPSKEYKVTIDTIEESGQPIVYVRDETTGEWREAKSADLTDSLFDYLTNGLIKNPQTREFMHTEKGRWNNFKDKSIFRQFVKYGLGYNPTKEQLADFEAKEINRKSEIKQKWEQENSGNNKSDLSTATVDFTTLIDPKTKFQSETLGETSVEKQLQLHLMEALISQSTDRLASILPTETIAKVLDHLKNDDTDYFNELVESPDQPLLKLWLANNKDKAMKQALSDIIRNSPELLKALQDSGDNTISFNAKDDSPTSQKTKDLDNLAKMLTEIRTDLKAFNTEGKYITIKSSGAGFAGAKALQMAKKTGYGYGGLANKGFSHTLYRDMQNKTHVHEEEITGYDLKEDLDETDNERMIELLFPDEDIRDYVLSMGELGDVTISQWITIAKNIMDSDCTILYTDSMTGGSNIKDALRTIGKPVLINPTSSEQIATFIAMNNAKIVNVDGSWEIDADMQKAMERGINQANTLFDKQVKGSLIQDPEVRRQYFKMQGLDTLLNTDYMDYDDNHFKITKTELQDLANALADRVSEMLDAIEGKDFSDPEVLEAFNEEFPGVISKDLPTELLQELGALDRMQIVKYLGPQNIVKGLKAWMNASDADKMCIMCDDLKENMGSILMLSQQRLAESEGFILQDSNMDPLKKIEKKKSDDISEDNDYENDADYILELEGDSLEHWQVEQRSIDLMDAIDNSVKREVRKLRLKDAEGNDEINASWGNPVRVNDRMALNSIVYWCQGQTRLSGMIEALKAKADKATWLTPLIEKLESPAGQYENLKSKFFSGVFSSKQLYSSVAASGNHYYHRVLNQCPELTSMMGRLTAMSIQDELSCVGQNGRFKSDVYKKLKDLEAKLRYRDVDMDRIALPRTPEQVANARYYASEIVKLFDVDIPKEVFDRMDEESLDKMDSALNTLFAMYEKALKNEENGNIVIPSRINMFKFRTSDGDFNPLCMKYQIQEVLRPVAEEMECANKSVVYNGGKTYQTYTTPSYLSKLFSQFQNKELGEMFIQDNYMKDQFLTLRVDDHTRKPIWWLQNLEVASKEGLYQHTVQLDVDGSQYMKNQTEAEHMMGVLTAYGEQLNNLKSNTVQKWGWFQIPIMSNKPSNDYVKMPVVDTDKVVDNLFENFLQECSRIQTVTMRNKQKGDPGFLKNWDTKGKEFNFLAFLEPYRKGELTEISYTEGYGPNEQHITVDLHKLITDHLAGKDVDLHDLENGVKEAIRQHLNNEYEQLKTRLENNGVYDILQKQWKKDVDFYLEKFIYNNFANSIALTQMTVGDLAFYKNADDAQKRFAQLHAPARKPNVEAYTPESEGHPSVKVSDGKLRVLMLADFNGVKSNTLSNIKVAFEKLKNRKQLNNVEKAYYDHLQEFIVEGLKNLEVTDGQSFNTISSYRKKAIMMGDWNDAQERVYQKYLKGRNLRKDCKKRGMTHEQTMKELREADLVLSMADIKTAFASVYKPFVFSKSQQQVSNGDAPISEMIVPIQLKNSEYTLMMADAIIQSELGTSEDNLLGAIIDAVEDTYYNADGEYMPDGIDTICFDSSCKSGGMTPLNINNCKGRDAATKFINESMYLNKPVTRHQIVEDSVVPNTQVEKYNSNTIRTMDFGDWGLQSDVADHFRDHSQPESSQARAIIPSDLATVDENGKEVMYDLGNGKQGTAKQFQEEYQRVHAENIQISLMDLAEEFNISGSKAERNSAVAHILQKEVLANIDRYGIDMLQACTIDLEGNFRLPLTDPQQCQRVEQMLNSIIKNRVNKQEIAGGPVVQVTNFGTSKELNIRFKDADGNLLPTRKEWEASNDGKYNTYEDYVKANQKSVAYFEVFAPIPSERFEQFMDDEGNIDVKTIEEIDPDLLKVVGLRIPTEAKYSIIPMKIVGFMPRMAGEGIMMPADITWATGSDFDVDKMYLQRIDKNIFKNASELPTAYLNKVAKQKVDAQIKADIQKGKLPEDYQMDDVQRTTQEDKIKENLIRNHQKQFETKTKEKMLQDSAVSQLLEGKSEAVKERFIKDFMQHPTDRKYWSAKGLPDSLYNKLKHAYLKATITTKESKETRTKNNNQIVRMNYGILTHSQTIEEQLNPGNFELQKIYGYAMNAYRAGAELPGKKNPTFQDYVDFGKSKEGGVDALKTLTDKSNPRNICDFSTNMAYYNSNQAAANLIGIFASQRVSHAQLSVLDNVQLRLKNLMGVDVNSDYSIGDYTVPEMQHIAPMKCGVTTERISKYFASLIGAAADAAKEPCLDALNINTNTINVFCTALRIGMPFETIAPLLSTQVMRDVNKKVNNSKLSDRPMTMKRVLEDSKVALIENYIKVLHRSKDRSTMDYKDFRKIMYSGVKEQFNQLSKESTTTEEIMKALNNKDDFELQYKIICAVERINNVANAYQKYDLTTKYNSINSAVGPWCTDNIIREKKMESLNTDIFGYVVKPDEADPSKLSAITPKELLAAMPINDQFSKAYDMAKVIMQDFPAYQKNFQDMIKVFDDMGMMNVISSGRNRNLLKNLQNQIQTMSYMEKSGLSPEVLTDVRKNFPKTFETKKKQFFTKHPELKDNKLLQNIYTLLDNNDNVMVSLRWNTQYKRDEMMNAWSDIYKADSNLAMEMYYYCVSIGGLGWNKKTWLQYLPLDMKENIKGYSESLKNTDLTVTKWQQLETFILHNWNSCPSLVSNLIRSKSIQEFEPLFEGDEQTGLKATKYKTFNTPTVGENCPLYVSTLHHIDEQTGAKIKDIYRFSHLEKNMATMEYTPIYKKLPINGLGNKGEYIDLNYKADIPETTLAYLNHDTNLPIVWDNGVNDSVQKDYTRKKVYDIDKLRERDQQMFEKQKQKSDAAIEKLKQNLAELDRNLQDENQPAILPDNNEDLSTEFEPVDTNLSNQQAKLYDDVTGNAPKADIPETAAERISETEISSLLEQSGDTKGLDANAVQETATKNLKNLC